MTQRERMPDYLPQQMAARMTELVQMRANVPREDLEYLVERVDKLKDERLKSCVAALIGWGDDERAELETFIAVALEVMKKTNPSKLRDAARTVHLRHLMKDMG
jgi:predicted TIM-barrel fold metal-dependent hydrolase